MVTERTALPNRHTPEQSSKATERPKENLQLNTQHLYIHPKEAIGMFLFAKLPISRSSPLSVFPLKPQLN